MFPAQSNKRLSKSSAYNPPPRTLVEPVVERFHGVEVVDPYRWLEDQNSPRTRQWLAEQRAYADLYFSSVPGRDRIQERVKNLLTVDRISEPRMAGARCFFLKRVEHRDQPVIVMREGLTGEDIPLVDPAQRGDSSATAVSILNVSADGKLLAYAVRQDGQDTCEVEILDVNNRRLLKDRLPSGYCRGFAFSQDGLGFYYVHQIVDTARPHYRAAFWHALGTDLKADREIYFAGEDPSLFLGMVASSDGAHLAYLVLLAGQNRLLDIYVHNQTGVHSPRRILENFEGVFRPVFVGETLFAVTDWRAPNGRVVVIDPITPEREKWRDIVPESSSRIQDFCVAGGRVFVSYVENLATRIDAYDFSGSPWGTLPCPTKGTARILAGSPDSDILFYTFTNFSQPPAIYCYDTRNAKQQLWAHSDVPFDPASIEVEYVRYQSKDGTEVPLFLVARKGRLGSGRMPTFVTGYGGFGNSITPQFTTYATFLIERGCLFAVANLRGGSEFGKAWHDAGKRHNRQNAIDDFIAASEWLIARGYAEPRRIAAGGGSNAGLLVAAAMTQRPDLFRAIVCLGPLLDMLRYHRFDLANLWVDEYGSAEDHEDFGCLKAYSPYHRIQDGVAYPAVLLISGDADTRCNPMHARKMTARLQAASVSGLPVLLDYKPNWGHMPVQPLSKRIGALTDRLAFVCHELGVPI